MSASATRRLTEPQARLYHEWIANRRHLAAIVAEMEKVGQQAAEILLQQTPPASDGDSGGRATRRSSRTRSRPR